MRRLKPHVAAAAASIALAIQCDLSRHENDPAAPDLDDV
jgi:hypothetical protein